MTAEEPTGPPVKTRPSSNCRAQRSQLITDQAFWTQNLQLMGSPAIPRDGEWAPQPHMHAPALLLALPLPLPQRLTEGPLPAGSCGKGMGGGTSGHAVKRPGFERTNKVQKATLTAQA